MAAHPCPPAIVPDQNFDTKLNALNPLDRAVLLAFALGALPRARSWVYELLYDPQMRPGVDKRPVQDAIRLSMQSLKQRGWLLEDLRRPGYWSPSVEVLAGAWQGLLMAHDTESLRLGDAHGRELLPWGTLYAHCVAAINGGDELGFQRAVQAELAALGVAGRVICGLARRGADDAIDGYGVMVDGLSADASLALQQHGIGAGRRFGYGLFVPHRSAAAVGAPD